MKHPAALILAGMAAIFVVELATHSMEPVKAMGASLPIFVLLAQLSLILLAAAVFTGRASGIVDGIARHGASIALLVALTATLGSLSYQYLMGLYPCELCWYQRILMYPLVPIIGIALYRNERRVFDYALPLCAAGGMLSAYHYYTQYAAPIFSCAAGSGADCSVRLLETFGFITIPLMALTAFISVAFMLCLWKSRAATAGSENTKKRQS